MSQKKVAIIMGSKSDLPIMDGAIQCLNDFGVSFDVNIVSAHRTPEYMVKFAKAAEKNGYKLIIAGAGGAAHLPGMVASLTILPVIGVPIQVGKLRGLDALLSVAQMPKGVPVACVAVDNSFNAGLLACRCLSIGSKVLSEKLKKFQKKQKLRILKTDHDLLK
jgi:5-(carboxyamino)imidazole ribonucleotide mutase